MEAAAATVLSQLDDIFALKEEQSGTFLGENSVFVLHFRFTDSLQQEFC